MRLNEATAALRRIYFTVRDADGALVADATGASAHLRKSASGANFAAVGGSFGKTADGLHYYEATLAEAGVEGFLWIRLSGGGYFGEGWAPIGDLFKLGQTTAALLRLPFTIYDSDGLLKTGVAAAGSLQTKTGLNGAAPAAAAGTLVEVGTGGWAGGDGLYYYQGVSGDADDEGYLEVHVTSAISAVAIAGTPVAPPSSTEGPTVEVIAPEVGSIIEEGDAIELLVSSGTGDVDSIDSVSIRIDGGSLVEIYDGATWDAAYSTSSVTDEGDGTFTIEVVKDAGWAEGSTIAELSVTATDEFAIQGTDEVGSWFVETIDIVPAVEAYTPEGEIDSDDEIAVDVTDDVELAYVAIFAKFGSTLQKVPVYRRGAFEPGFSVDSSVEEIAEEGGVRFRFHVVPDSGVWPPGEVTFSVDTVDAAGQLDA